MLDEREATERGKTRSYRLQISLWKRLWTCCMTAYVIILIIMMMMMV